MENSHPEMTPGEVVAMWRQQEDMQEFIQHLYYDEDVWAASLRFYKSDEFQSVLNIARRAGKPSGHVLDIGGGNGVAALAWCHAGYTVTIIEPDDSDVVGLGALYPVLKEHKLPIHTYHGMGESTPFADRTFDIVYCRQVLHHIPDLPSLMREIRRVIKDDGVFIATREHVLSRPEDLEVFLAQHPMHVYTGGEHAYLEHEYLDAMRPFFSRVEVIQFYDSVINYFPLSENDLHKRVKKELCRFGIFYHLKLCRILARLPFVRKWAIRRMNARNHTPGRPYSFIAYV